MIKLKNSFLVFIFILVPFLFHLSTFIFLPFFFFCTSNEFTVCFICMSLFLVYHYLPLTSRRRSERQDPPYYMGKKLKFLLPLLLCYSRYLTGQFTLFLSSLPSLGPSNPHPNLVHRLPFLLVRQEGSGKEVAFSPARFF